MIIVAIVSGDRADPSARAPPPPPSAGSARPRVSSGGPCYSCIGICVSLITTYH